MMKRFSRRRKNGNDGRSSVIDAAEWLPKMIEQGIVEATSLEPWNEAEIPNTVAAIGRGERADGSKLLVAFSPTSASQAVLGGLAAAAQAHAESGFAGQLLIIAPQWPAGARRLLGLLGSTPYSVEPVAAAALSDRRIVVEAEPAPRQLATSISQLAARMKTTESRAAFTRAARALEGLAAKHGGCVRLGMDRLELVVMARRVAEVRTDGESAVLEVQVGGRSQTPLSGADLAGALDGLEGQLRRRLNDRKVREGEDGLRARVVGQLAEGSELRGLRAWPQPGEDLDDVDAVGIDAEGVPVVVAVREELEWGALAAVLESLGPVSALLPVLFSDTAPPLRLDLPRLLLVAERFAPGLERVLTSLVVAYELRAVSGTTGAAIDLVRRASGEGAESRPARRGGRRRGGRGRASSDDARDDVPRGPRADEAEEDVREGSQESAASESSEGGREARDGAPRAPRALREDRANGTDEEDAGRGRSRRRRRPRRGRGAAGDASGEAAEADGDVRDARDDSEAGDEGRAAEGARRRRPRFEEVSLMDLDDGPPASSGRSSGRAGGSRRGSRGSASSEDEGSDDGESRGRSRRRGRRGGGRDADAKGDRDEPLAAAGDEDSDLDGDSGERSGGRGGRSGGRSRGRSRGRGASESEDTAPEPTFEEEFVDADDLSEILARLPDDVPDFEAVEPSYDDEEDVDEDGEKGAPRRRDARRAGRGESEDSEDSRRAASRKRSAILVHADRDSLFAAILLARDIRQLDGIWIYPQSELMTFFRSVATDIRDDTPIFLIGFSPSPARDVIQASSLYRGRLTWFDRHAWPPEDLAGLRESLGADAIVGGDGIDSSLPLVLETCSRRSRFSDKLVDLATGRFTQHDFERWGRLWRWRAEEIAAKTGDIRADVAPLLAGRPSDLAKEAALVEIPPPPPEVEWVAARDFRLVHFGAHMMVVLDVDPPFDPHLASRIARERYDASLSLARQAGAESFIFGGDESSGKRSLDYLALTEHLAEKLEWVDALPDSDHVARFRVRGLARHPERFEEVVSEIAMGRSMLER